MAVQCKARRCYGELILLTKNEGDNFFPHFARTDQHYTPLCTAFGSGPECQWPYHSKIAGAGPVHGQIVERAGQRNIYMLQRCNEKVRNYKAR